MHTHAHTHIMKKYCSSVFFTFSVCGVDVCIRIPWEKMIKVNKCNYIIYTFTNVLTNFGQLHKISVLQRGYVRKVLTVADQLEYFGGTMTSQNIHNDQQKPCECDNMLIFFHIWPIVAQHEYVLLEAMKDCAKRSNFVSSLEEYPSLCVQSEKRDMPVRSLGPPVSRQCQEELSAKQMLWLIFDKPGDSKPK